MAAGMGGCPHRAPSVYEPREGDIIFQSFPANPLTEAIEGVTRSPLSHCGIVHATAGGWVVIEAVGPVQETPLGSWEVRGRGGCYEVFRLRERYRRFIPGLIAEAGKFTGRPYDIHYTFDDQAIYCSELVYKAFRAAAGQQLGKVQALGELDWRNHAGFIKQIENGQVPLDRRMITPRSLSEAPQLERVFSNYPTR